MNIIITGSIENIIPIEPIAVPSPGAAYCTPVVIADPDLHKKYIKVPPIMMGITYLSTMESICDSVGSHDVYPHLSMILTILATNVMIITFSANGIRNPIVYPRL